MQGCLFVHFPVFPVLMEFRIRSQKAALLQKYKNQEYPLDNRHIFSSSNEPRVILDAQKSQVTNFFYKPFLFNQKLQFKAIFLLLFCYGYV